MERRGKSTTGIDCLLPHPPLSHCARIVYRSISTRVNDLFIISRNERINSGVVASESAIRRESNARKFPTEWLSWGNKCGRLTASSADSVHHIVTLGRGCLADVCVPSSRGSSDSLSESIKVSLAVVSPFICGESFLMIHQALISNRVLTTAGRV